MATSRDDEHACEWRTEALDLREKLSSSEQQLAEMSEKLEALQKKLFGKSTEKMPPMDREVRRGKRPDPAARAEARRKNAETRDAGVQSEQASVPVPPEDQRCPACVDGGQFSEFGPGKQSSVLEYVEGYFRRRHFTRQVMSCSCGRHIVTAPVPDKVFVCASRSRVARRHRGRHSAGHGEGSRVGSSGEGLAGEWEERA